MLSPIFYPSLSFPFIIELYCFSYAVCFPEKGKEKEPPPQGTGRGEKGKQRKKECVKKSSRYGRKKKTQRVSHIIDTFFPPQPAMVVCKNGSSVGICTHCAHVFCTFGADLRAQSVLIDKNSASELARKFIRSPLLVGSYHIAASQQHLSSVGG